MLSSIACFQQGPKPHGSVLQEPNEVTNGVAVLKPFILRLLTISYIQLTAIFSEDIGTLYVWE